MRAKTKNNRIELIAETLVEAERLLGIQRLGKVHFHLSEIRLHRQTRYPIVSLDFCHVKFVRAKAQIGTEGRYIFRPSAKKGDLRLDGGHIVNQRRERLKFFSQHHRRLSEMDMELIVEEVLERGLYSRKTVKMFIIDSIKKHLAQFQ